MSRRDQRILRWGLSLTVGLFGVACGIVVNGELSGTLATIGIGIGMLGILSTLLWETGLTGGGEARRERAAGRPADPRSDPTDGRDRSQ